jgi:hypothetical protein
VVSYITLPIPVLNKLVEKDVEVKKKSFSALGILIPSIQNW